MTDQMPAPGRSCGSCTLCCNLLAVGSLAKPQRQWCGHCSTSAGCTIYAQRPAECAAFHCAWLTSLDFGEHWAPVRSRMIVVSAPDIPRIEIQVDDGRPDAWRREPYYSELKAWSRAAVRDDGQVMIYLRDRAILILPHKDVDLGQVGEDDRLVVTRTKTLAGQLLYDVIKIKAGDPRFADA